MSQVPPVAPTYSPQLQLHRGGIILALGILSIAMCFVCRIIAWVMANNDLRMMAVGQMDPSGRGTTRAGKVCGIIGTVLGLLGVAWVLFWMILFGGLVAAGANGP